MKSGQLTVITPCLNAAPHLRECLRSVDEQGPVVARHIVMDGGSRDGSVEILRAAGARNDRLLWLSATDTGQSEALNKALSQVETEYFGWLNADDCYAPGALTALLGAAAGSGASIVYGDYKVMDGAGRVLRERRQPSFNRFDCIHSYMTVTNVAALFHADATRACGGFDPGLRFCMDYDLVLQLSTRGAVRHVRQYCGYFRLHEGSKTSLLQDVCAAETASVRRRYARSSGTGLRLLGAVSRLRVLTRMAVEGCLWSRVRS